MPVLILFLFGISLGSFTRLFADRYQPGLTTAQQWRLIWRPASFCTSCRHALKGSDILPVFSFLLRKGHCRYCCCVLPRGLLISELMGGLACGLAFYAFPDPAQCFAAVILYFLLSVLCIIDSRYFLLPDGLVLLLLGCGLLFAPCFPATDMNDRLAGIGGGFLSLYIINKMYRCFRHTEGIGGGDMKLLAAIGAWSGWLALPGVIVIAASLGLFFLFINGTLRVSLKRNIPLPFGSYLSAAGWGEFMLNSLVNSPPVL